MGAVEYTSAPPGASMTRERGIRPARRLLAVLVWTGLLAMPRGASATGPPAVPPELQAAIFSRVLAFDRALKDRVGKTVTIGIVFNGSNEESKQVKQRMTRAFLDVQKDIQDLPCRISSHDYHDMSHLASWIDASEVDVLYVTDGLEVFLDDIKAVAYEKRVATLTPVRGYVERGLAIGVVAKGNRPQLVVNLPATKAAGMDLDPKALQLSEVIR